MQWQWQSYPTALAKHTPVPVFFNIQNVEKVFRLAQDISKGGSRQQLIEAPIDVPVDTPQWQGEGIKSPPARTVTSGPLAEYLRPDERILWQGQPDKNIHLFRKPELMGLMIVIISTSVLSMLVAAIFQTVLPGTGYVFLVWIGFFALVVLLAFAQETTLRKSTYYAVSDQRIIELIKLSYGQPLFKSADLTNLRNMLKSPYNDGTASIYFTPPAKGLAAALFGQEALMLTNLNPMSRKEPIFLLIDKPDAVVRLIRDLRQKKGLPDISQHSIQARPVLMVANASLKRIGRERKVSPLLTRKMFLFSPQAVSAWLGAGIASIFTCIALNMLHGCHWNKVLDESFQITWAIGVLSITTIGIIFLFYYVQKGWQAIQLLKTGARAQGVRLPDERLLLCVNNQPAICQRNYEFTVNDRTYQVKSITGVNQPRQKNVTILFDPSNPERAVVLDDLPGCPIISDDDTAIEFRTASDSKGYQ